MKLSVKLQPGNAEKVKDRGQCQRLVGRLIYYAHTPSDIIFSVSVVSHFMHSTGS